MRLQPAVKTHSLHVRAARERDDITGLHVERSLGRGFFAHRQFLDPEIPVAHHRGRTAVNLDRDDAAGRDAGVGLREIHRLHAIEPDANARPLCANTIVVPFTKRLACFRERIRRRTREHPIAAALVVKRTVVAGPEVSLITRHLMRVRDALRAELHTAIHKTLRALQLPLQIQLEVRELPRRREKIVFRLWLHQ